MAWPACASSRNCCEIAPNAYEITVFGAEPHPNYNRILLSPVLAGEKRVDEIILNPLEWYREKGVTLHTSDPVVAIDRVRRIVRSRSGVDGAYDRLLLATGSKPVDAAGARQRICPASSRSAICRTSMRCCSVARKHSKAVVIGGGLLGWKRRTAC